MWQQIVKRFPRVVILLNLEITNSLFQLQAIINLGIKTTFKS